MTIEVWTQPKVIIWTQVLLDNYEQILGHPLFKRTGDAQEQAERLFFAPFVVLSHGTQADPIFNYGNKTALDLWEMTWQELTTTPSRLTAEPPNQKEREMMLAQAAKHGFIENYTGIRISRTGKRFRIENFTIWNLLNSEGTYQGQAATGHNWTFL